MIVAKNLAHEFFRRNEEGDVEEINRAIDDVSLEIKKGEFVAILGSNGSGKSTFAKHINALLYPTEGSLWVGGYDAKEEENMIPIRKTTGMVFQNPDNQIVSNIVEEDVGFGPENLGIETKEIWKRVEESLKRVGMLKYRHMSPNRLSGGQKQRVAIAGILAMKPKCIILDESTAMLDPVGRREVLETIYELNKKEGITILLITHYMEEVVDADRIYVMSKGKVVMTGTPEDIFSRTEELKKWELEPPQTVKLAQKLREQGIMVPKGILRKEEMVEYLKQEFRP